MSALATLIKFRISAFGVSPTLCAHLRRFIANERPELLERYFAMVTHRIAATPEEAAILIAESARAPEHMKAAPRVIAARLENMRVLRNQGIGTIN